MGSNPLIIRPFIFVLWVMSGLNALIFSTTFFRVTNAFTRIGPISLVADSAKSLFQYRVKYIIKCHVDS